MKLSKMREELYVLEFILKTHEKTIDKSNEETISSEIEKKMLEMPLADSWMDYLLLKDEETNTKLKTMIGLIRQNLQQVIEEKHLEELERIRPSFDKEFDPNREKRYL
ncbi:TPA: hypothetical protein K8054_000253 [Staphylococcus pseudintermedius]|uniref:hypothetical protein n=1 Tax=Staphylococcus TaxID=1279 RepID=UPI000C1C1455|nr:MULTISPECIES: hypothetical protein [Staphylococcus]NHA37399.1 hypothetical protein [Staphylococcus schleiferi]EGQ0299903.1 hypothetical protein [Staphylococcus pseudintermedius]EGQ1604582.1 hypothetical protein [Staphylococcus pseudintermedius]EGQ2674955.1 hypothetical protein [Staphylococcus pseudintermedius]EGQ2683938.1 hypothetical protein [Staphylococcus pseudintermedius]